MLLQTPQRDHVRPALCDHAESPRPAPGKVERQTWAVLRRSEQHAHEDLRAGRCARRAGVDELQDLGRRPDGEVKRKRDLLRYLGGRHASARDERAGCADVQQVELLRERGRREDAGPADIGRADKDDGGADRSILDRTSQRALHVARPPRARDSLRPCGAESKPIRAERVLRDFR